MFKFRRSKNRHAEDDDDDEPMMGKGQSARSGVGNGNGSSSVPTPNQKLLGKQHQQTQQKKGLLGLRSRSAPRSVREQDGRQHRTRSASSQDDHDSTDSGTDAYTASDHEQHSPVGHPAKGRPGKAAGGHDNHDDDDHDDESSHDRTPPMKNGGDDHSDDSDSSSYPSVGMNVVSSNAPNRAPPPRKNSQSGLSRKGSRGSPQRREATQESGRRRDVERAMGELNSALTGIKRMQQQQQQQQQQSREGLRTRAPKGKNTSQVSPTHANANHNPNNALPNNKHRRNQSSSNVTTATHQTTGTTKTAQSDKTRGTTGTANTANTTNTSSSQKSTENAAMQQLAMLVVSLRGDLEELKKEKEGVEEKLKDALRKNKQNSPAATPVAPAAATTSNEENPFLQELKQENIELRADIDAFLLENDMLAKEVAELKEEKEATNDLIGRLKKEAGHNASCKSFHNSSATLDRHASNGVCGASSAAGMEIKNQQLTSKLQELTDENHKLEGELRLLVDEKQDLMRRHATAVNDVSIKEKEVEELKGAVKEMADRLVAQNEEREKDDEEHEKEQTDLVARLREDVADLTIVKEELKRELKESAAYIAELEAELDEKNERAKADVDRYATEIGEYEKGKIEYEAEIKKLREGMANVEEEKSKSESELTKMREEVTHLKNQKEEFQKRSNELDVRNVELTTKINDLVIQRSRTQKELERLKEANAKISDELKKAKEESTERVSSSAAVASAVSSDCSADTVLTLQKMISTLETSKEMLEAELVKKDAEIQSQMEKVSQLEQKLKVQEEMASTSGEEESDLKIRIAGLLTENEKMKPRIARLEEEKNVLEEELSTLKGELSEKENSFDKLESSTMALQADNNARVEQMYDLEETVSSLQQTKDRLEADLQEASEAIALLEDELDRKDSATNEAMVQVIILRQQVSQVEKEKAALTKRNEELGEKIDDLNTQIKVMIIEKTVASEEIESLQHANEDADRELRELVESSTALKEELTKQISKLREELEESSDAIALLKEELGIMEHHATENDATVKKLEASLLEKDTSLQSLEMAKKQLQTEHQVNIDTISTLQKIIQTNEKNQEVLELELKETNEKVANLRKELANSRPASQVTELEEKLAEVDGKNEVLMERVSELSDANEEMRKQIKDMLIESRPRASSDALVTRSCSAGADPRLMSADRAATCNTLIFDLKKQIQDLLSERDAALEEVEVLKRESTAIYHRPDDDEVLTEAPQEDDEDDVDDDMTYHTSAVETKPCEEDEEEISIPSTVESFKFKPRAPSSSQNSRGSSLLEQAKKICHELEEKRSKTPDAKRAEAEQEVKQPKRKSPCTESIKTVLDENAVLGVVETAPEAMVHGEKHKNTKPASRTNSTSSEKKFDIDQLTSIYFEKCGTAASKLSDMSSDASSVYRRNRPEKNNSVTKKVKICRNGVFMGTYEGDLNAEGQRHGFGILICDNGNSYEGDWKKDKRDGLGIARYSSGDVYDGEWQRGKRQGHGVMYIEAGDTYIGSWHNGLKHGAGTYHWADGEVDVSWYQEDRRVGEGVRWNSSRNKAYRLIRGTRQEEISLDEAYKTAEKLGLNLAKVDSVSS